MKIRPKTVTPIIPKKTAVPSACRSSAPGAARDQPAAPTPRMKAKLVIRIGRRRGRAASTAASIGDGPSPLLRLLGELDDQDRILGGERDQHDQADLGQDIVVHARAG